MFNRIIIFGKMGQMRIYIDLVSRKTKTELPYADSKEYSFK
jgi:hypothetical protein